MMAVIEIGRWRICRPMLAGAVLGVGLCCTVSAAPVGTGLRAGENAFRRGEYQKAAAAWQFGDSEQQELLADLLLGSHRNAVRHGQYDAIHYLYRAAIGGRPSAMRKLSILLRKGSAGARRSPVAARCWAALPTGSQETITCVAATEFQPNRARPACSELVLTAQRDDIGIDKSKLCLANKTPALLVPGLPPGTRETQRIEEYAQHGIEWVITGDVYDENFERFRENFNTTMATAIEAERGRGYLVNLSKTIETHISRDHR